MSEIKALLFDVFGTVVDWRTSLIDNFTGWGNAKGIKGDWVALVDNWRGAYVSSMDEVRKNPDQGFRTLDDLQRQSIEPLAAKLGIVGLTASDLDYLARGWHSLHPWPDSVAGLTRLKTKFIIGPLSNGNVALLTNMAKFAGLPWDLVLSAEIFGHYKPDREAYLGAAKILGLTPGEVMLVAAHNSDLTAAQSFGLKTAFVPRVTEYGPHQSRDFGPEGSWDYVVKDFNDLANKLVC
jgi:2-haloacid dehalogenase